MIYAPVLYSALSAFNHSYMVYVLHNVVKIIYGLLKMTKFDPLQKTSDWKKW